MQLCYLRSWEGREDLRWWEGREDLRWWEGSDSLDKVLTACPCTLVYLNNVHLVCTSHDTREKPEEPHRLSRSSQQ